MHLTSMLPARNRAGTRRRSVPLAVLASAACATLLASTGPATATLPASTTSNAAAATATWPLTTPALGIYNGGLGSQTDDGKSWAGDYPDIASSYYVSKQQALNVKQETARIQHGTIPLITLTTGKTGYLSGIVNGNATALAWLDTYIASLKTLSEVNPGVPVMATLDHEYDVQMRDGSITGSDVDSSGKLLGKALNVFYTRVRAKAPNVKVGVWFASSPHTVAEGVLSAMTQKPDWVSSDYYSNDHHSASESLATTWSQFSWFKTNSDYQRLGSPPLVASEFGSSTTHGDASLAAYYKSIRTTMKSSGLMAAVLFNSNSGPLGNYKLSSSYPQGLAAFKASLAG